MNWDRMRSAVATREGLVVRERQADGTLGDPQLVGAPPPFTAVPTNRARDIGPGTYAQIPQHPSAPPPFTKPPGGSTTCPPGTHLVNGQCVPTSACPPGMVLSNGQCVYPNPNPPGTPSLACPPGTHLVNGQCVPGSLGGPSGPPWLGRF